MDNETASWLLVLFFISLPLVYAAYVFYDMKREEQRKKKS